MSADGEAHLGAGRGKAAAHEERERRTRHAGGARGAHARKSSPGCCGSEHLSAAVFEGSMSAEQRPTRDGARSISDAGVGAAAPPVLLASTAVRALGVGRSGRYERERMLMLHITNTA